MAKHFAREAFETVYLNIDGKSPDATQADALEAALSKMVECLKP